VYNTSDPDGELSRLNRATGSVASSADERTELAFRYPKELVR
jgi:hypothetical protein